MADRALTEEQLATQLSALLRLALPLRSAALRDAGPLAGPDRSALLLLIPLLDGPQRPGALADLSHADPSTVSRQVADLVRGGLVRRQADPSDGRASLLAVTDAGREVCDRIRARRRQLVATAVVDWTEEELTALTGLLARFTGALAATTRPAGPPARTPDRDQALA